MWKIIPSKFKHFNFVCNASKWAIYVRKYSLFMMDIFSQKSSKKYANQSFCKNSHFFKMSITTNQITNSGLFFFYVFHLILLLYLEHIFLKKRASNVLKIHSSCESGFNHFWKISSIVIEVMRGALKFIFFFFMKKSYTLKKT